MLGKTVNIKAYLTELLHLRTVVRTTWVDSPIEISSECRYAGESAFYRLVRKLRRTSRNAPDFWWMYGNFALSIRGSEDFLPLHNWFVFAKLCLFVTRAVVHKTLECSHSSEQWRITIFSVSGCVYSWRVKSTLAHYPTPSRLRTARLS